MALGRGTAGGLRSGAADGALPPQEDCHSKIDELFSGKLYLIGIAAIVVAVIMVSGGRAGTCPGPRGSPGADRPAAPPARSSR